MKEPLTLGKLIARLESAREQLNDDDAEVVLSDDEGECDITGVEVDEENGMVCLLSEE